MKKISKREKSQIFLIISVVLILGVLFTLVLMPKNYKSEPQPRLTSPTLARVEQSETILFGEYTISVEATHEKEDVIFLYSWDITGDGYYDYENDVDVSEIDFTADTEGDFVITCEVVATLEGYEASEPAVFTLILTVESNLLNPPDGNISISPKV